MRKSNKSPNKFRENPAMPTITPEILAEEILRIAGARELTICTAESCSAGRLALAFSKGEGASKFYMGGVIALLAFA